jgi:iron complex outermembrane receptor protein
VYTALLAAASLLGQASPAPAQVSGATSIQPDESGRIAGVLKDPSGAVLAGAQVEVRNLASGFKQARVTDSSGHFEFVSLPSAHYRVTAIATGFASFSISNLFVRSGQESAVNISLQVASATTVIQVEGQPVNSLAASSEQVSPPERGESRNTAEIVAAAPGVSLRSNGELASIPMLHGLGEERTKVVVDGMTVSNSCPNHMNPPLSYVAPAQAAQVTVVAGITPVSLGGDSLGGTVSVESRLPVFAEAKGELHEESSATGFYGSNGESYGSSVNEWIAGQNFGMGYAGRWVNTDDYTDGAGHKVTSSYAQSTEHTLTLAAQGSGNLLVLQVGLRHTPYEGFVNAQMDMVRNYAETLNLRYRRALGSGMFDAHVFWQNTFHEMNIGRDKSTFPMPMWMPMNTHGRDFGYTVRYDRPLAAQHTLHLGNELHRFVLDDRWPPVAGTEPYMAPGTFVNVNDGRRIRLGTFAEVDSKWTPKWSTLLGLRNDTVWTNAGQVQGYSDMYAADAVAFNAAHRAKVDPDIDLTALARYDATGSASFELGYARKSRAPNLYERYAWSTNWMASGMIGWFGDGNYYVGNIGLKPEVAHTVSGTALLKGHGARPGEVKLTPYLTYVQDYIDVNQLATTMYGMSTFAQLQFANHDARLYGGDLSGKLTLWDGGRSGHGGITGVGNWVHGSRTDTGKGLYQMMPLNLKINLEEEIKGLNAGFGVEAVDRKSRLDPNRLEQPTPGYALFNLHVGYRSRHVEGSFRTDNLLNRVYELPLGGVNFDDFMASMWMGQIKPLTGRGRSGALSLTVYF